MGLIEAWGNGLRSICNEAQSYGLPEPEFVEMPDTFRVNLFRKPSDANTDNSVSTKTDTKTDPKTSTKTDPKTDTKTSTKTDTKADSSERILQLIEAKPTITIEELMKETELSKSGVRYTLEKLRTNGAVKRIGGRKNGSWVIITKKSDDNAKEKKLRQ